MKIAICFYGLVGSETNKSGVGVKLPVDLAGKFNAENLIDVNKADVFIHSWSESSARELVEFYSPVNFDIEKQQDFEISRSFLYRRPLREIIRYYLFCMANKKGYDWALTKWKQEAFRAHSRWRSTQKVLQLLVDYENKVGIQYDAIVLTRLDVGFFSPLKVSDYDLNYIWVSNWNNAPRKDLGQEYDEKNVNENFGVLDFWFFSSRENIINFLKLYDHITEYSVSPHRSAYEFIKNLGAEIRYTFYRWKDHEMVRRKFKDFIE